ncbi:MAG: CTP synthase [Candidatus Magasanikbacteria bacterium]
MTQNNTKYIFVVGGVMSGVGKGVTASSIGKILQSRGLSVSAMKIDPYVNVDAGTMNPTEHGEVFVLDDGTECDQDMGNYERFLGKSFDKKNYMTTGSIYKSVIEKERNLEYDGKCVSVVPHIPLQVISQIDEAAKKDEADFMVVEVGGTVGEYENILFLEAIRILSNKREGDVGLVLVSFLPFLKHIGELKTKPTQHAVRNLQSVGLQPDIVIARAKRKVDQKRKDKIAFHCSVREKDVISAPDVSNIYEIPFNFEKDNLGNLIFEKVGVKGGEGDMSEWRNFIKKTKETEEVVNIGIVGKYFETGDYLLSDSYISVIEAIKHASYDLKKEPEIDWLNAADFEDDSNLDKLKDYKGIIVPGGFGQRAIEGKISAIGYCRKNDIPYFGLCYGMQLALVEFARSVLGWEGAHTTEINEETPKPVVDFLPDMKEILDSEGYGGTMRLGAWDCKVEDGTIAKEAYGKAKISERHRHRYEVNPEYVEDFKKAGIVFSGASADERLMEIMELPRSKHPFFVGTQFHPEFKSRPLNPHPLFLEFIRACDGS